MRKVFCFLFICLYITGCTTATEVSPLTIHPTTEISRPTNVPTVEIPQPTDHLTLSLNQIVFASDRDGNLEIYTMDSDGSNQTRLTNTPFVDAGPAWSSDGQKIAFFTDRDGNFEIYSMGVDGEGLMNLSNNPWDDDYPDWSPDMSRIVFDSFRDGNFEIYLMNADGSNQTRLTSNPDYDGVPRWSPDGKFIAFTSARDGNTDVYVMNSDGSNQIRLTDNPADDTSPVWSPDGKYIAFDTLRDGEWQLYTMNSDGTNQSRITYDVSYYGFADWSHDGQKFVFLIDNGTDYDIYSMDAKGGNVSIVVNLASNDYDPRWSPATPTMNLSETTKPTESVLVNVLPSPTTFLPITPIVYSQSNPGGVIIGSGITELIIYGQRSGTSIEGIQIVKANSLEEVQSQSGVQIALSGNGPPLFAYFPNQPFTSSDGLTAYADMNIGSTDDPNISIGFLWSSEIDGNFPSGTIANAQKDLFSVQSEQSVELEGWLQFAKVWLADNTGTSNTSEENLDFFLFHNDEIIYVLGFLPDYQYTLPTSDLTGAAPTARSGEEHTYLIKGFLGGTVSIPIGNMIPIPLPILQVSSIEKLK